MTPSVLVLHGTTIALRIGGRWRGALVRGRSGAGKSDLALRALSQGWRLVADDRTLVWRSGDGLYGRAPETLAGLMEARGVGVVRSLALPFARLALVVRAADGGVERMPDLQTSPILETPMPHLDLKLCEGSSLSKLALALAMAVGAGEGGRL